MTLRDRTTDIASGAHLPLGEGRRGFAGVIMQVGGSDAPELIEAERRLIEIGFVEGAHVEILHEGFIGRDPIAVKLDDMRVAIRRREANLILVQEDIGVTKL